MRLVFALPADVEERLLGSAIAHRHEIVARPAGAVEVAAVLGSLRPDAAIVGAAVLRPSVIAAAEDNGVRIVALVTGATEQAHAEDVGATAIVDAAVSWESIEALLRGDDGEGAAISDARGAGRVIAVWGPTGAPGRTTTALGIASELAIAGKRVALIDADTHGASVATALGLLDEAAGIATACRMAAAGGLDLAQLDRISTAVPTSNGSLRVLTGIARPSRWPELSDDRLRAVLRTARHWADAVVVDAGFNLESDEEIVSDLFAPRRNAATLAAIAEADQIVAVGAGDAVGLARLLREHSTLLELVDPSIVSVVVNKVRAAAIGIDHKRQILDSLRRFGGIDDVDLIPLDQPSFDASLAAGRMLSEVASKSPARVALSRFVERRLLTSQGPPPTIEVKVTAKSRFAPA